MEHPTWINDLSEYWINRCNIKNKKNNFIDISHKNKVVPNNFVMFECIYQNGIHFIFDEYTKVNHDAIPRLTWYKDYFEMINNNYNFRFYFNHLDIFGKPHYLGEIDAICMGCSVNSNNFHAIPILDAHHLWEHKKNTVYNPKYDLNFNTTPFDNKIKKIVWRGD